MNATPVDQWYAVEASPKGGLTLTTVRDMLMRNQRHFVDNAWNTEVDYRPLWLFKTLEQAEDFRRAAREERKKKSKGQEHDNAEGGNYEKA